MPWNMKDYPSSLKNEAYAVRKKAIDIANAMVDEGYDESRAIPIATKQAKTWYNDASKDEINAFVRQADPTEHDDENEYESRPEMLDKNEHVVPHQDGWAVKSQDAEQPSDIFTTKDEAVNRAKEIAKNKGSHLIIHKQDGTIEEQRSYE